MDLSFLIIYKFIKVNVMYTIKQKIQSKDAAIGIIGIGYVGLPLATRFSQEGFVVTGFDIDDEKVNLLNAGKSYIKHINVLDISAMANDGFRATSNFSKIAEVDVIIICVPTPLGVHAEPDLSFIHGTLENIHRAVNIGLVNELKMVADKMNIDIYEVIQAAATKPFGFIPYYPGPGLGGHCIPIDPFYLTWKAKEMGMNT